MSDDDALKKRIEALENENRALRSFAGRSAKQKVIVITEGSYQGHPTISFEAGGRPFTLGLRKASIVLHCREHIQEFVSRHKAEIKDWEIVRGSDDSNAGSGKSDLQI